MKKNLHSDSNESLRLLDAGSGFKKKQRKFPLLHNISEVKKASYEDINHTMLFLNNYLTQGIERQKNNGQTGNIKPLLSNVLPENRTNTLELFAEAIALLQRADINNKDS